MALSKKNQRQLKRLRKHASSLWAEQQAVLEHARELRSEAGDNAKRLRDTELLPYLQGEYNARVRPNVDRGLGIARDAADDARVRFNGRVVPAAATIGGSIAGTFANLASEKSDYKGAAKKARGLSKTLDRRAKSALKEYDKKYNKKGIGVGGWFLIGAGVAAVAAVGYALWQTFRADDDLWIADEELDAPVTTVSPSSSTSGASASAPSTVTPSTSD
ncbi:hypothetical protein GCM10011490_19210 [Pseudoclavibacter endophyticus]|uniref:DNA/RNA helicase n=1 Tax=Pseudoclavibacter endophyticus TaxID=1778590 RepID=A0A6H9WL34_9MICO|nr:DNA/RNA helicase [Pseudoclavibacter endophyticus]KAB1648748.1 DNA/RNA helicase [Pseudoclavibacter endophyticus]GGA68855.1 hypothetical protein GCM10011490_19210 [Pseudoclavibacter endophyticus]